MDLHVNPFEISRPNLLPVQGYRFSSISMICQIYLSIYSFIYLYSKHDLQLNLTVSKINTISIGTTYRLKN